MWSYMNKSLRCHISTEVIKSPVLKDAVLRNEIFGTPRIATVAYSPGGLGLPVVEIATESGCGAPC